MRCPYCGTENRPEARFCRQCGASLTTWSPSPAEPPFSPSPATPGPEAGSGYPSSWAPPSPGPEAYPTYPSLSTSSSAPTRTNPLAIVSLFLGILGLCPGVVFFGIAALITGLVAHRQISQDPLQRGKGLALAGEILGILSVVLLVVIVTLTLLGTQVSLVFSRISSALESP